MIGVTLKYIRHSVAGFIVWPKQLECLSHRDLSNAVRFTREPVVAEGRILSAGFIQFNGGNHKPFCYGRSDSLNVDSLPEDTDALRTEWGMQLLSTAECAAKARLNAHASDLFSILQKLVAESLADSEGAPGTVTLADAKTLVGKVIGSAV